MLTILLPYWGDVNYMLKSVESVLNQENDNWCLVIVDDNYPGNAVKNYLDTICDSRIKYFRNVENLGANANYRKALEYVNTSHFVMFGADDIMKPNYVDNMLTLIQKHEDVSIFHPGVEVINGDGNLQANLLDKVKKFIRLKDGVYQGSQIASRLMVGNFTYFPSITWKTSDVRSCNFRGDFHVTQDLALICDLLLMDKLILLGTTTTFQYRRHLGSDSSLKTLTGDRFGEEIRLCKDLSTKFRRKGWYRAAIWATLRPTNRLHMMTLLPKVIINPKIFIKTLKGAIL